jgi:rhamnose utilization protein RhaD (predicted bifunctional aldolase and dehydrogenase)
MELTGALGADPLLTQAAGGGTSIKLDGVMWTKASEKWLLFVQKPRLASGAPDRGGRRGRIWDQTK